MPAASLIEAVRRVSLVADRASPVRLTFGSGTVALEAQTEGRARAIERVTASFHGDEPAIAFNPHYLLDGITAAAGGSAAARHPAPPAGEAAEDGTADADAGAAPAGSGRIGDHPAGVHQPGPRRADHAGRGTAATAPKTPMTEMPRTTARRRARAPRSATWWCR